MFELEVGLTTYKSKVRPLFPPTIVKFAHREQQPFYLATKKHEQLSFCRRKTLDGRFQPETLSRPQLCREQTLTSDCGDLPRILLACFPIHDGWHYCDAGV